MAHSITCARKFALALVCVLAAGSVTLLRPSDAEAQRSIFTIRGEGSVGTVLNDQTQMMGFNFLHIQATGRIGFSLVDSFAIQLGVNNGFFLSNDSTRELGRVFAPHGGLRFEPRLGEVARFWIDANANLVLLGLNSPFGALRFMYDVGLGIEFQPARWFGIGPFGRFHHLLNESPDPGGMDPMYWSAGLSFAFRVNSAAPPRRAPPPLDSDGDGEIDRDDLCPFEPAGAFPDTTRRGCPLHDADHDTVSDSQDQCVNVPRGDHPDPDRAGCPDGDDDSDRVLNHDDQCRTEAAGDNPDPMLPGCPLRDRDHDTVADPVDHCPDQPGAPHPDPERNGCPGLVERRGGQLHILQQLFFATSRDTILDRSFPVLQAVADALRASPDIHRVSVEGHTDDVGRDEGNLRLSESRARSVVAWLTQHDVDPGRLEAHGLGETRPLTPVTGLRGGPRRLARAQNRRVEFRIIDPVESSDASSGASSGSSGTPSSGAAP